MDFRRSKEEEVQKISTSIFVTDFPDKFSTKDLWNVCNQYGSVVDAFIPNKKYLSGSFKLHENVARFLRPSLNKNHHQYINKVENKLGSGESKKNSWGYGFSSSYVHVVKNGSQSLPVEEEVKPALVLDDTVSSLNGESYCMLKNRKKIAFIHKEYVLRRS
nr:nucleotide-binding alpha-beta plait domain-containing protein [Tanacetum cinerariifolium]